jgi:hypothetical protein
MPEPKTIGTPPWTADDMRASLEEFASLYQRRPIKDNQGGMRAPHAFLSWFVLRALKPKVIIESGVWLGQGTWLFEQACPDATLFCIDLNLSRIEYKSAAATYYDRDFSTIDWNHLPKDDTLVFFDDHQDYYQRAITSRWFGFTHLMFEDNYPAHRGNCYSLKQAFAHAGFKGSHEGRRRERLKSLFGFGALPDERPANSVDAAYLEANLDCYAELPPVFRLDKTRWGDAWDSERYPTPAPLLNTVTAPYQQVYFDEGRFYTWMCYARLKSLEK